MDKSLLNLLKVRTPSKYLGGEYNSAKKPWNKAKAKICLIYPDDYELGTSSVGLSILYHLINSQENYLADRIYAPWVDRDEQLKNSNEALVSLDHQLPLNEFDVIGFSIPYELTYTNILSILSLSNIDFMAKDRKGLPLIIAGGSGIFNPEPIAEIFDAIILGDGEEIILDILNDVSTTKDKNILFNNWKTKDGIYIPSLKNETKKAVINKLDFYPKNPLVPHRTVHSRVAIEAARGCTRGCRFCQAGYTYRPLRQRTPNNIKDLALSQIESTGHDELSLLSLSISDYKPLKETLAQIHNSCDLDINVSLPSLRAESISAELTKELGADRTGSFTLAPEAGSDRLRKVINKGNSEDDLLKSAMVAFSGGWQRLKLYFMIGLPTETDEDVLEIANLARKCLKLGQSYHGRRTEIVVSASTFIPKPHTPFQWEKQIDAEETKRKHNLLRDNLRSRGLSFKGHNPNMSQLEGVLCRGGRDLLPIIISAWENGAKFDAWTECFSWNRWEETFAKHNFNWKQCLDKRDINKPLPWDHLLTQLDRKFLLNERSNAFDLVQTEDCRDGKCSGCGICNSTIKNIIVNPTNDTQTVNVKQATLSDQLSITKVRLRISKEGKGALIGHVDFLDAMKRSLVVSKLPIIYTEGFHKRPRFKSSQASSVGINSEAEYFDIQLYKPLSEQFVALSGLPDGIKLVETSILSDNSPSLAKISAWRYQFKNPKPEWKQLILKSECFLEVTQNQDDLIITQKSDMKSISKVLSEILNVDSSSFINSLTKKESIF